MRKIVPGAVAGIAIAAVGFAGGAQAQCWFNGGGISCAEAAYAPSYGGTNFDEPGLGYYHGRITGPPAAFGAGSHMGPVPGGGYYRLGVVDRGRTD